ncbi:MAG: PAS domain S-box protein [Desulfovibrionaceae bacterium]
MKRFLAVLLLSLLLGTPALAQRGVQDNVLLLLSYDIHDRWSRSTLEGVRGALAANPAARLFVEYFDARHAHGPEYQRAFAEYLLQKYQPIDLRLAIAADDAAFDFILGFRPVFQPRMPVVFCGVNNVDPAAVARLENVTGVNEAVSVAATVNLALELFPESDTLAVIGGSRGVGSINLKDFDQAAPRFSRPVDIIRIVDLPRSEAAETLGGLPPDAIVLRMDNLREPDGGDIGLQRSIALLSKHARGPVFSFWDFDLGAGALGGVLVSGLAQGRAAGRLALEVLGGRPAGDIPPVMDSPNLPMFDFRQMQRFGLQESALPGEAVVVNRPPSFYRQYRGYTWMAGSAMAAMALFIALLLSALMSRRRALRELRESENRYRAYVDNAPMGIFIADENGRYVDANPEACAITGYRRGELLQKSIPDLRPEPHKAASREFHQRLKRLGRITDELPYLTKDGEQRWWTVSAIKLSENRFMGFVQDVTLRKEQEKQLQLTQYTVDNAAPSIFWITPEGRFLYANKAACRSLGYSRDELLSMGVEDVDPSYPHTLRDSHFGMLERKRVSTFETMHRARDGRLYPVEVTSCHLEYEGMGYEFAYAVDITEKKQAHELLLKESSLNKAQADIARKLVSPDMTIEDLSGEVLAATQRLTGSPHGFVSSIDPATGDNVGHTLTSMMGEGACEVEDQRVVFSPGPKGFEGLYGRALNSGEGFFTNDAPAHPDSAGLPGGHVPIRRFLTAPAIYQDRVLGQIALANAERDYTGEDLRAVSVLADLFALAVADIRSKNELRDATEKAQAANKAKSMFLANMSHEIRTPLNGLLGMLQLLDKTGVDDEQRKYLRNAILSCNRLTSLLSDVLDLARVESGKMELVENPFNLVEALESVKELFGPVAGQKGVGIRLHVHPGVPHLLAGDAPRLQQVLNNLVGNAVKFTDEGAVDVEAYPLPSDSPEHVRVLFSVSDSGCGIQADKIGQIFEAFTQSGEGYTRTQQGAGLGLAIVRRIVELMDGSIAAASREGQGSAFHFCARFCKAGPAVAPRPPERREARPASGVAGRALVVDDDPISLLTVQRLLEHEGLEAATTGTASGALEALQAERYDLVFMDIQLPDLDGMEVARRIRSDPALAANASTPIIALTAYALAGDRERFLEAGMDGYLAKPLESAELIDLVRRRMAGKSAGN